ncbi:MAG: winged helix-turn-helix domain-containing protein [Candidatus Bathycorpusculaceae bacterium]
MSLIVNDKSRDSNTHRGRLDIIADILEASQGKAKKTYLMNHCNLSFRQLRYYVEFLHSKGLLHSLGENENPGFIRITEKGKRFLKAYRDLKSLMI